MIQERRGRIRHLLNALATKPFLLLAGISGSGKTQLARRLAAGIAAGQARGGAYTGVLSGTTGSAFREALKANGVARSIDGGSDDEYIGVDVLSPAGSGSDATKNLRETLRNRVAFLPVRPDWSNSRDIWGYFNPLTGLYYPTDAIRVVLHAYLEYLKYGDKAPRHFLILDELNLARVEYYLSDLLSLMESGCTLEGSSSVRIGEMATVHPFNRPLWTESGPTINMGKGDSSHEQLFVGRMKNDWALAYHYLCRASPGAVLPRPDIDFENVIHGADWGRLAPSNITFTPNLCIIGTVNVDETTFSFAPKVLDRAFVMEFNEINFDQVSKSWRGYSSVRDDITTLNALLRPANLHFGYRVLMEVLRYLERSGTTWEASGDFLITSKILTKLRGSEAQLEDIVPAALVFTITREHDIEVLRSKARELFATMESVSLEPLLEALGVDKPRFPEATRKLHQMTRQMFSTGLTSYF